MGSKICLHILALSLWCRLVMGQIIEDLAPVIPLHGNECRQTCHTEVCGDEALRITKLLNEKVDPCDNFYEFACGSYIKNTPAEEGDVSIMTTAQGDLSGKTNTEIIADIEDTDLEAVKKTKIYYKNCLDEDRVERAGRRPLVELLNNMGGWPVLLGNRWDERRYNWLDTLKRIKQPKMTDFYFPATLKVSPGNEDTSRNAIKISGVNLIIGPTYFPEGQNNFLQAYLNNMVNLAVALGARNDSTTLRELQQVLDFEVQLYKLTTPAEVLDNMPDDKMDIAGLSSRCPGIPWLQFINQELSLVNIVVDEREQIYVNDLHFICGVAQLTRNTPKRVIANYLAWRVAKASLNFMSKQFLDIETEFKNVVEGPMGLTRMVICLMETMGLFPVSISTVFARKYFDSSAVNPITELFNNLKSSLRKNLEQTEWMDERTRHAALEKIDAMNVTVGFAKELLDDEKVDDYYRNLQVNPGLYLQSAYNVTNFLKIENYKTLRHPTKKTGWTSKQSAAVLNAYYINEENNVEIPAGTIKIFYKKGTPQYVNYGVLGTFVGHEVMHGFDTVGKNFDKNGNQVNWWQPAAEQKFREKARCLIEQYGNFTVPEINMKVNGELTQTENIADNGGFKAAYIAYNEWAKRNNIVESCLPSLNYTPQQMFWINAATVWCGRKMPETLQASLSDEHSPDNARIILTFSNIKEFAKDFNCPVGSKMNPEKKCTMW